MTQQVLIPGGKDPEAHKHDGTKPILIGGYHVHLAKSSQIPDELVMACDYLYPLNGSLPGAYNMPFGTTLTVVHCHLPDRGGVPANWEDFIRQACERIKAGKKLAAWCMGSHGRTGVFAASCVAIMEPDCDDPIAAIRERHCKKAVESLAQAEAIFKLKGMELPEKYKE